MNYHRLPALAKKINCIITLAILLLPLFYGLSGRAQFIKIFESVDKTYPEAYIGQFFTNRPQPCTAFDTLLKPANLAPLLEQTIAFVMRSFLTVLARFT